jgi:putative ABC transport system substrate-binding protein
MTARAARAAILLLAVLVLPPVAEPQATSGIPRVGYLAMDLAGGNAQPRLAFLEGLRELGYVEGKNVTIEYRDAEGKSERLAALAAELVALKVDVILGGGGTAGALALKRATTTVPIVFGAVGDPVSEGVVSSLARPGGNLTGLAINSPEITGKAIELLKQAVPGATRVALLVKPDSVPAPVLNERVKVWDRQARALGMRLQVVHARGAEDFDGAFSAMVKARADVLTVLGTPLFDGERRRLAELSSKYRLPTVYSFRHFVDAGGLMSYGPDIPHLFRRAATYVDKILKGAKPGDLPVEQPTKFELVLNLKTARALGLKLPPSVLQRADQVIE